jgi:hypothetical protein
LGFILGGNGLLEGFLGENRRKADKKLSAVSLPKINHGGDSCKKAPPHHRFALFGNEHFQRHAFCQKTLIATKCPPLAAANEHLANHD